MNLYNSNYRQLSLKDLYSPNTSLKRPSPNIYEDPDYIDSQINSSITEVFPSSKKIRQNLKTDFQNHSYRDSHLNSQKFSQDKSEIYLKEFKKYMDRDFEFNFINKGPIAENSFKKNNENLDAFARKLKYLENERFKYLESRKYFGS